jgi:DNA-directed RNA polymerase alpha subunit
MSISGNNKNELDHEERTLLNLLFEQKISLKECALVLGITKSQAQQALMKVLEKTTIYAHEAALDIAKLRENKEYWRSRSKEAERIIETLRAENDNLRYTLKEKTEAEIAGAAASLTDDIKTLGLSVISYNCLIRHGATSVGDILDIEPHEFITVRNLGEKSQEEVIEKMRELGFASWVRGQEKYRERSH